MFYGRYTELVHGDYKPTNSQLVGGETVFRRRLEANLIIRNSALFAIGHGNWRMVLSLLHDQQVGRWVGGQSVGVRRPSGDFLW